MGSAAATNTHDPQSALPTPSNHRTHRFESNAVKLNDSAKRPCMNTKANDEVKEPQDEKTSDLDHVDLLGSIHGKATNDLGTHQRLIEKLTRTLGHPRTLYLLLLLVMSWAAVNGFASHAHHTPWDPPPFFWLQGCVALYASVVSTLVLITQTRQQHHAEQRAYLDLQINLTSEQKTAKVISLLEELRRDIPSVHNRVDLEAEAMTHAVDAKAVIIALASTLETKTE
jgi:uncharacterized membrane protein